MLQRWLSCNMKRWRANTIHRTIMQDHFSICKFGNKQMTQEVTRAQMRCTTIWGLKGVAPQACIPVHRTDGLLHEACGLQTHPNLKTMASSQGSHYCHSSPIGAKAQWIFPVSCHQPKPLHSVALIPIILGWWEEQRLANSWEAL